MGQVGRNRMCANETQGNGGAHRMPTDEFMATATERAALRSRVLCRAIAAIVMPLGDACPMRRRSERDYPLAAPSAQQRCARGCRSLRPSTKYRAGHVARFLLA